MTTEKMRCPHCGRCIGEFTFSDDSSIAKVLKVKPKTIDNKTFIYDRKCQRCKKNIVIIMGYKDN